MNYAEIKYCDIANGPGCRVSLFVSGCPHRCKGCFNPETWNANYGLSYSWKTADSILEAIEKDYIDGLSLLGGEPLAPDNWMELMFLAKGVKRRNKTVWCYTGYLWEDVKDLPLLMYVDVLVDGPFIEAEKDISLRFKGSRNQRIIDVPASRKANKVILYGGNENESN